MKDSESKRLAVGNKSPFLSAKTASVYLGFSPHTLRRWRQIGKGPHYFRISRSVRYSIDDLNAWLESRRRLSTSDKERQ